MRMDSLFAIGVGLGLRAIIDAVTHHSYKASALIGIWEGVVLNHFLVKLPTSFDPYVAFGFRLFVDFLFTESLTRMTIIVLWTGMGMLFADLGTEMGRDRRFRRTWRRTRRMLKIPSLRISSHGSLSRVRFIEGSAASSNSHTSLRSSTSPPTRMPAPILRPTTTPLPGQFDGWSEASTDIGRVSARETSERSATPEPEPTRSPSELEYISLPVIPDQSPIDPTEDDMLHPHSGLTTPTNDHIPLALHPEDRHIIHSGLTTPEQQYAPLHSEGVPPVRILNDEHEYTPTGSQLDLPPIPIRPPFGDFKEDYEEQSGQILFPVPHISDLAPALPSPGFIPPDGEIPNIPTADDTAEGQEPLGDPISQADNLNRSPPPQYEEPNLDNVPDNVSLVDSEGTLGESVVSGHSKNAIIARADSLREAAKEREKERDRLRHAWREADRDGKYWEALKLNVELEEAKEVAEQLNAKAAHRYYRAHNLNPEPQTIDVHRLSVPEAVKQTRRALRDAMMSGSSELRIITGRGKHSKKNIPVLKLAIIGDMQKHHINASPDRTNPGILVIALPSDPTAAPLASTSSLALP